jgi:hypothetical protein
MQNNLYSLFLISYHRGRATGNGVGEKSGFIWNYCNKHPALQDSSYQYDPSKETYVLELTTPLFSNKQYQITNVVYETYTTATRALAPENIPKQIVTSFEKYA